MNWPISCFIAGLTEGFKVSKESTVRFFSSRPDLLLSILLFAFAVTTINACRIVREKPTVSSLLEDIALHLKLYIYCKLTVVDFSYLFIYF